MATTKKRTSTGKKGPARSKSNTRAKRSTGQADRSHKSPAKAMKLSLEERWRMIALAAYHKAEQREFAPGHEVDDWLAAERDVEALLGQTD